ncbi:unnamed protein product [Effrenium voratum]|uniref:alpha-1,2-Mannosidase n=1 Tax=Effrenium voratum TaxID=2562239 RepID=A0AA36ICM6_9DINO|nr:unnamed protein product [Effrenium voratum]
MAAKKSSAEAKPEEGWETVASKDARSRDDAPAQFMALLWLLLFWQCHGWQTPAEVAQLWDPQTLASFSTAQLSAFGSLARGECPLLSRAVRCTATRRKSAPAPKEPSGEKASRVPWKRLAYAYLKEEASLASRQARSMVRHVWRNYERLGFGKDELKPVSGRAVDSWGGVGQMLVDSLDTLWLTGLREEFHRAADWVEESLDFNKDLNVNYFETSIRHLGGLLSAYVFSQRSGLLRKAADLATRLAHAFPSDGPKAPERPSASPPSASQFRRWLNSAKHFLQQVFAEEEPLSELGTYDAEVETEVEDLSQQLAEKEKTKEVTLPLSDVNLQSGQATDLAGFLSLADEIYVPVEWKMLALLTSNCEHARQQDQVLQVLNASANLERGLVAILLQKNGDVYAVPDNRISLGSRGDSFYEYLLKDNLFLGAHANPLAQSLWVA